MNGSYPSLIILFIFLLLLDWYIFEGFRTGFKTSRMIQRTGFLKAYRIFSTLILVGLLTVMLFKLNVMVRVGYLIVFFVNLVFKLCFAVFLLVDDIRRAGILLLRKKKIRSAKPESKLSDPLAIPRSEFLLKAGLIAGAVPLAAMKLTMKSGLYDYQVVRKTVYLPNLPKAFDGIKVGQISDIHSGSFFDKKAVAGGVEMLMREKADLIFFTGDIVNSVSNELRDYQDLFAKIKAPLGVYSCLGNHDYGDYATFSTQALKDKNHQEIINAHKSIGWDLLQNTNRRLKVNGEEIGILGIENWGAVSNFPKYGRMDLAVKNTDDLPVKLLLSHDPSHWRAQVLPQYPQIDMMFSGHTHGMQMGVRTANFQWSPVEYIYHEWAGLYHYKHQQLYVNVGYGFLGFRGRVGILPEITIFELKAGAPVSTLKT